MEKCVLDTFKIWHIFCFLIILIFQKFKGNEADAWFILLPPASANDEALFFL
jgi:hypothetical protein